MPGSLHFLLVSRVGRKEGGCRAEGGEKGAESKQVFVPFLSEIRIGLASDDQPLPSADTDRPHISSSLSFQGTHFLPVAVGYSVSHISVVSNFKSSCSVPAFNAQHKRSTLSAKELSTSNACGLIPLLLRP